LNIENLPDFPALKQVAEALWESRASVLVGAGFSLNAQLASPASRRPPLWTDLAKEMKRDLYPERFEAAPTDPLRLAEEYRCFFGQAALNDFIRRAVPDLAWAPSRLHNELLRLPWSDVLTTNYDTLLERAAQRVNERDYTPVRMEADLAHARAPRIVKLHGSLGTSERFIIAEEDYRTYPTQHAAFVNFARQSLIENELCLFGFSGDDPNFLQWTGWVRDQLGQGARRIYLVGLLGLSPPKRKYLAAINVVPVDLAPLVTGVDLADRHSSATAQALSYLRKSQPEPAYRWEPNIPQEIVDQLELRHDPSAAANAVKRFTARWAEERRAYPQWLICPRHKRTSLRSATSAAPWPTQAILSGLSPSERAQFVYELVWRQRVAFDLLEGDLIEIVANIAYPDNDSGLQLSQQLELAVALAYSARACGAATDLERWLAILTHHASEGSDFAAEVAYLRALVARDRLDFKTMRTSITAIKGQDPIWMVRAAGLRCETGDFDQAEALVSEAIDTLRERKRQDKTSLWTVSRLAWAEWLARLISINKSLGSSEPWTNEYRDMECDPRQALDSLETELREKLSDQDQRAAGPVPTFEHGGYVDSRNDVHITTAQPSLLSELTQTQELSGISGRLTYMNVLGEAYMDAQELSGVADTHDWTRLIRLAHGQSKELLSRFFDKISIARMNAGDRNHLIVTVAESIGFYLNRYRSEDRVDTFLIERMRGLVEVLARLAGCSPETANEIHQFGSRLAKEPAFRHFWLFEALGRLMDYTAKAVPLEARADVVSSVIEFPLPGENQIAEPSSWPRPAKWILGASDVARPENDQRWASRIQALIRVVASDSPDRGEATVRLVQLGQANLLLASELDELGDALWSTVDDGSAPLPAINAIYISEFAWLPAPASIDRATRLRARLYSPGRLSRTEDLVALRRLCRAAPGPGRIEPTEDEAARIFDQLVVWRPPEHEFQLAAALARLSDSRMKEAIGFVLGESLSPLLALGDRTPERWEALLRFIDEVEFFGAFLGVPDFALTDPARLREATSRIGLLIHGTTFQQIQMGTLAMLRWEQLSRNCSDFALPGSLAERVISAFEIRRATGLSAVISCLSELLDRGALSSEQVERFETPLGSLLVELDYRVEGLSAEQQIALTVNREQCVKLSKRMIKAGITSPNAQKWLEGAATDPVPEVRFAADI
jgi:hypothetical protein